MGFKGGEGALQCWIMEGDQERLADLEKNIVFRLGCGSRVLFWSEKWWEDIPLKERFPEIQSLAGQEALVSNYLQINDVGVDWSISFIRNAQDWEMENFLEFFAFWYGWKGMGVGDNGVCCSGMEDFLVCDY